MTTTAEPTTADDVDLVDVDQVDEVDEQPDLLSLLTIDELNTASRLLKASMVVAITRGTQDYERALAVLAFMHARRTDPAAKLSTFTPLTFEQLSEQLAEIGRGYTGSGLGPTAPSS